MVSFIEKKEQQDKGPTMIVDISDPTSFQTGTFQMQKTLVI